MPNVAATTERVSTSPFVELDSTPTPILQLATKLCSACSCPLNIRGTQQHPMVSAAATRASLCPSCIEASRAEGDRLIGRNRANSSKASSQPMLLSLASPTPNAVPAVAPSSVSNHQGRPDIPGPFTQNSSRDPSQDAHGLSISPTPASYFLSRIHSPSAHSNLLTSHTSVAEPLTDITRLRVRSLGIGCLSPGETFLGIQTNQGREHRVSVTILDVNLGSSTLAGSLTIHNLTPDIPELTTYFDGEIIGSRFGFLTPEPGWSSTEESDLAHWERFGAPFRAVRSELRRPDFTMRGGERGDRSIIFMRWKEKFLMPDHKVTSVMGASFSGFYYICLELGGSAHHDHETGDIGTSDTSTAGSLHSLASHTAHLSGYYYFAEKDMRDQYQKLTLHHVPRTTRACFEFR